MKQIIYLISLIIILGACTDEKYSDTLSSGAGAPGKLVPVELVLHTQPMQSPLPTGTKAGSNIVSSTQVCKGMEISLVETPVTRAALEDEIVNFSVLQFNGTTPESTLSLNQFIPNNSVKDVKLITKETNKNKIIVIANADQNVFNNLEIGVTTLAEFNNMGILYNANKALYPLFPSNDSGPRVVFVGSTEMVVAPNKQVDVMLYRSVALVKVNLSLSSEMEAKGYTNWGYQFMNIPDKSFYHSIGRTAPFPGETVEYINYPSQSTLSDNPSSLESFLPVNLQYPVPFTTPELRVTNAPLKATYLQLVGMKSVAGVITQSVVYQIHLGSNFTDDYSISPNYSYTYKITITGESDDDSRVIKFVAGYFGGSLKMYKKDQVVQSSLEADTWRYDKRIEVYVNDVNPTKDGVAWVESGSGMPSSLNDLMNGRQNTLDLNQNIDQYPAAKLCIGLNPITPVTNENMVWYMPSYGQSLGIYVAGSKTLKSLPNTTYWSSTANETLAWGTQVWSGQSSPISPTTPYSLRCVKDLEQTNVIP